MFTGAEEIGRLEGLKLLSSFPPVNQTRRGSRFWRTRPRKSEAREAIRPRGLRHFAGFLRS